MILRERKFEKQNYMQITFGIIYVLKKVKYKPKCRYWKHEKKGEFVKQKSKK